MYSLEARLNDVLLTLASSATSQREFRQRALERIREHIPFDGAIFHGFSGADPLETGATIGIEHAVLASDARRWEQFAGELSRLRKAAAAAGGVVVDSEAFSVKDRANAGYYGGLAKALNVRALLMANLQFRDRLTSGVALVRRRNNATFTPQEKSQLRAALPVLAIGDAVNIDGRLVARPGGANDTVVCSDERLTVRQRDIVSRVAMGHTNAEIAQFLGLSPHTVRNILARIFRVVGASNRADLVRLSVLR